MNLTNFGRVDNGNPENDIYINDKKYQFRTIMKNGNIMYWSMYTMPQCVHEKKTAMKFWTVVLGILIQSYIFLASMYTERGVGEYGIRFSHFCGPVLSKSDVLSGSFFQFSFGMNALRLKSLSGESTAEETLSYHIIRGKLTSEST